MSSLLTLQDIDTEQELQLYGFYHAQHHLQIVQAANKKFNLNLRAYILDPINLQDEEGFLFFHQQAHNDFNLPLGYNGVDLQDVDFKSPVQKRIWIRQNFDEHYNAEVVLGIHT